MTDVSYAGPPMDHLFAMSELEFRPRFRFRTSLGPDVIGDRLRSKVRDDNPAGLRLGGTGHHHTLRFPYQAQRSWTPQMDIDLEVEQRPDEEPVTIVRCQIGPSPSISMLFVGRKIGQCVMSL